MALKIKSISGIEDIVVSFADSANNVPATGIVGLETSGNIEKVIEDDKVILVGQDYVGKGVITISGNEISANLNDYYNVDEVNELLDEKYDTSAFENVSGTFLTAHQNLDDYATKNWVEEQNYITGVDLSNYYTKSETSGKTEIANALTVKQNVIQSKKNSSLPYLETINSEPSWEVIESEQINAHGIAQEGEVYNTTINGRTYTMVCLNGKLWLAENYVDEAKDIYTDSKYGSYFTEATIKLANFVPQGWHLPTKEEYQELIDYTENHEKYLATTDWHTLNYQGNPDPNYIAGTNELKLNILPGGEYYNSTLHSNEYLARFWTNTDEIHAQSTGKQRIYVKVSNYIGSTRTLLTFDMSGPGSQNCYNVRLIKDDLDVSGPDCWKTFKGKNFMAIADNEGNTFKDFYLKKVEAQATYQPIGSYVSSAGVETLNTYYALTTTGWKDIAEGFYNKTSIDNSLSLKQDNLLFAGENNTITAINTSAIGDTSNGKYVPLSAERCKIGSNNIVDNEDSNYCDFAQGNANTATQFSLAQGGGCLAQDYSIAQGGGVTAKSFAISQGGGTVASSYAIAQGAGVTAKEYSIAQGGTVSADNYSFGQGTTNTAYNKSLAQGCAVTAKEYSLGQGETILATDSSLAQGSSNTATNVSFAQGQGNIADTRSFAEGTQNSANYWALAQGSGNSASYESLAQGVFNYAHNYSLAVGSSNSGTERGIAIGINNTANFNSLTIGSSNSAAFASLSLGQQCRTSTASLALGTACSATLESFAQGDSCSATKNGFAQGSNCYAEENSFAQGSKVSAKYYCSLAQGYNVSANYDSFAQGNNVTAAETGCAQGFGVSAFTASLAQGKNCSALRYSLAQGLNNTANDYSVAVGQENNASNWSMSIGYANTATNYSFAGGSGNNANTYNMVYGINNIVNNNGYSFVVGTSNTVSGSSNCLVAGVNNTYSGGNSAGCFIAGASNFAKNDCAVAIGSANSVYNTNAIAIGISSIASADGSIAIGSGVKATQRGQIVLGRYNASSNNASDLLIVGNGQGVGYQPTNAMVVKTDGLVSAVNLKTSAGQVMTEPTLTAGKQYSYTTTGWHEFTLPEVPTISAENGITATTGTGANASKIIVGIDTTNYKLLTTAEYTELTAAVAIIAANSARWVLTPAS